MKKLFTLALLALLGSALQAQSNFTDDFETYTVGDLIGKTSPKWETWGGTTTIDDAPVSDEQAKSGTKSLKLVATAATQGGPSDIICKFGGAYVSGNMDLKFNIYVKTGAYFNLQAENAVGTKWAADFRVENELLSVNVDGDKLNVLKDVPFPSNKWVNFNLKADITSNLWEVFLDNVSVGKFGNTLNKIASINFYPTIKGTAAKPIADLYYIDDFSYDYTKPTLPVNDGCLYNFAPRNFGLAGMQYPVWVDVRNTGSGIMAKFDVMIENGKDTFVQSFSGQNMASLAIRRLNINTGVYKLLEGNQQIRARLLKVGGVTNDGNPANNLKSVTANGFIAAEDRAILVEQATGTWCTWCPRGHVYMDSLSKLYPGKFIGIAVHNNDPMTVPEYDQGLDASGFPLVFVNRDADYNPDAMELPFLTEVQKAAPVRLQNGATFNAITGELTISVTADVKEELSGDYFLNAIIVEDSLRGTTNAWAQVNAYAGGGQGVMGGFEKLPNPVPANRMVYSHVGRAILGGYYGKQVAATLLPAGSKHHDNFKWVLAPDNKKKNIKIVGVMYDADGKVVNAIETTIDEAVNNGFVLDANVIVNETRVSVVPNPADGLTQISIELKETAEVSVRAYDMLGRQVSEKNYGLQAGEQLLGFSTADLEDGVYNFVIMAGNDAISRKVIVKH